jgi:hypothetical protein
MWFREKRLEDALVAVPVAAAAGLLECYAEQC